MEPSVKVWRSVQLSTLNFLSALADKSKCKYIFSYCKFEPNCALKIVSLRVEVHTLRCGSWVFLQDNKKLQT